MGPGASNPFDPALGAADSAGLASRFQSIKALGWLCLCLVGGVKPAVAAASDEFAFKQNAKLGRGVNVLSDDPRWRDPAQARMTEKHFKLIKEAGFQNVRIPIKPFRFSLKDADHTIAPEFFTTLDWAVREALSNKLMVIVDFHEHSAMGKDPLGNKAMFLSMWKQIALHCRDLPMEVLFEIANEPNMKAELWNTIHGEAYRIIRESNPDRTLLIGSIYGNQIQHLPELVLPEDDRNLIVAIHYYRPMPFTHQGAPWSEQGRDFKDVTWLGNEAEKQSVEADFAAAREWSMANRRPLTLGEFGAYDKGDMASRERWTSHIARRAEAANWSWSYWQFDSDFIVYDIDKDQWVAPILRALIPSAG